MKRQTKKSGLLIALFILTLVLLVLLAGCTNSVSVQTKSAKARLASTGAPALDADPIPAQTPATSEPSVRYELTESTGNATCDNILKSIYPMVNVAIAEE